MKDAVATMGDLLPDDAAGRDAVHVAVFSARSPVKVFPGQHVGLVDGEPVEFGDMVVSPLTPHIGIIDPFLNVDAAPGARFWVYLYPRTITSLAHKWGHPAFEETQRSAIVEAARKVPTPAPGDHYATPTMALTSERWLRDWCEEDSYDRPTYKQLMNAVEAVDGSDEYLTIYGTEINGTIPGDIWGHVENVLGRRLPSKKPTYFSCSC